MAAILASLPETNIDRRFSRDIQLAFIRLHLLHPAAQEPSFGSQMIDELARRGCNFGTGTLYPILHARETAGLPTCGPRVVNGKVRKNYTSTAAGRQAVVYFRGKIWDLEQLLSGHA